MADVYKSQEDYVLDSKDNEYITNAELTVKLKKIHIYMHEYLHDTSFKTRNWNIIVYPDSAPEDWIQQIIEHFHVPFVVSPLHDMDVNADGEIKKPHWHVTICFEGPKSWLNVTKILSFLNCAVPVDCISLTGSVRYMAHLDNPEKYQYDPNEILGYCGFSVEDMFIPSQSESDKLLAMMIEFLNNPDGGFEMDYNEFLLFCIDQHYNDWYKALVHGKSVNSIVQNVIKAKNKKSGRNCMLP